MSETTYLSIGDYICLLYVKISSNLYAEGILTEDVFVGDRSELFSDCIFQVQLQRQYSAASELAMFLGNMSEDDLVMSDDEVKDPALKRFQNALERGQENENKMNDHFLQQKLGRPVVFGDIIQLFHVKSGKYLTVSPSELAKSEKENVKIYLSPDGDNNSWLQILPRFKIDREGDRVAGNTEAYFRFSERGNEFLHCADKALADGTFREVNSALDSSTPWRVNIYQRHADTLMRDHLLGGQLVYFLDPEIKAYLTVLEQPVSVKIVSNKESNELARKKKKVAVDDRSVRSRPLDDDISGSQMLSRAGSHGSMLSLDTSSIAEASLESVEEFVNQYGNIVLTRMDVPTSNILWILEKNPVFKGGNFQCKSDAVRLRHLNTGKCLAMFESTDIDEEDHVSAKLQLADSPSAEAGYFLVTELNPKVPILHHSHPVNLLNAQYFAVRGEYFDEYKCYNVSMTKIKAKATSMVISYYSEPPPPVKYSVAQPLDSAIGISATLYIMDCVRLVSLPDFSSDNIHSSHASIWSDQNAPGPKVFHDTIIKLKRYVRGFPICVGVIQVTMPLGPDVVLKRQNLLKEQGVIEAVVRMLSVLAPVSYYCVADTHMNRTDCADTFTQGTAVISSCLGLLIELIKGNQGNQLFVADFLMIIIAHAYSDPLAGTLIQLLLIENIEVQETKVTEREIKFFADMMLERDMGSVFLDLMQACCVCRGKGVPSNQLKVLNALTSMKTDILIKAELDYSKLSDIEWGNVALYPVSHSESDPALGKRLFDSGAPHVLLTWKSINPAYSPDELFSGSSVSLYDVFRSSQMSPTGKGVPGLSQLRNKVCAFYISQLSMMASICVGRNYSAMKQITHMYPVELLLTIIVSSQDDKLRGAAIRLAQTLYVDSEPQTVVVMPRFSRTYNDLSTDLDTSSASFGVKFSIFQQLIAITIRESNGKPFGVAVYSMCLLLQCLISFNFYVSMDKIRDVLLPLIDAIDRKKVEYEAVVDVYAVNRRGSVRGSMRRSNMRRSSRGSRSLKANVSSALENLEKSMNLEEEEEVIKRGWQKIVLDATESLQWLMAIVSLVLIAVGVAAYEFILDLDDPGFSYFDYAVFAIFVFEFSLRSYCYRFVNKEILNFIKNPFNQIDLFVILIDVLIFVMGSVLGKSAKFSKVLRMLRLIRLFRLFRAAKLINKIINDSLKIFPKWKRPTRYTDLPEIDVKTTVAMLQALRGIQTILEDRYISAIMQKFHISESDSGKTSSPSKLFFSVCDMISETAVSSDAVDDVLIDLIMYSDKDMVQCALDILMTHHTAPRMLVNNLANVQMLVSTKREKQYQRVEKCLLQLQHDADTHSVWGKLQSEDHKRTNLETFANFKELIGMLRKRRQVLEFDEEYEADSVVQDMMRNLGCFDMAFTCYGLLHYIGDDTISEAYKNTIKLLSFCSEMFYWLVKGNQKNQEIAYEHLDIFVHNIDRGIYCHRVISAIFVNNISLMKLCPKSYIAEMVDKIVHQGRSHNYLVLLSSVSPNVIEKQYEVIRQLSNPLYVKDVLAFFCPVNSSSYEKKKRLMVPCLNKKDITTEDLPSELAYHLELLKVFSGCTIGRANMNSVEAKVQSLFNFNDVVMAVLDPNSPIIVKIRLLQFFFNAMIEVEMKIPNLGLARSVWMWVESTIEVFNTSKDLLRQIEKTGWEAPTANRQKLEYMIMCARVLTSFFALYYDRSLFKLQSQGSLGGFERVHLRDAQIGELIRNLFGKIRDVYEMQSPLISIEHQIFLYDALIVLNKKSSVPIVAEVKIFHKKLNSQSTSAADDRDQKSLTHRFTDFKQEILDDEGVKKMIANAEDTLLSKFEKIPASKDPADSDVRIDPFIEKLVFHLRTSITITVVDSKLQANMDAQHTKTAIWIIKMFRSLIERKWGMTIHERDDDGGAEQDEAFHEIMTMLNECGATTLCFDLIVSGIDTELQMEAINLLVAMLFKEGGNLEVQTSIYKHFCSPKSEIFFARGREIFQDMIFWHNLRGIIELGEDDEVEQPPETMILRVLQLMCEGHYGEMQDIYRAQSANHNSINLLDDMVAYFMALNSIPCKTSTTALLSLSALILEIIQGPCEGNQDHFALNTELVEILNKQLRAEGGKDADSADELELKKSCIDIFQALLEGQGSKKDVYDRVLSVVHIDIIYLMSSLDFLNSYSDDENTIDIAQELQVESLVLLQMLCNYKPSIRDELGISDEIPAAGSSTASVEVVWRGELQRRFFHVPDICLLLSESSRVNFVETVDRKLQENKLTGLLEQSRVFHREILHQKILLDVGLSSIFSRTNLSYSQWISFFMACILNLLQLLFYSHPMKWQCQEQAQLGFLNSTLGGNITLLNISSITNTINTTSIPVTTTGDDDALFINFCGDPLMIPGVLYAVLALNIALVVFSVFNLISLLIVRSPIIYQCKIADLEKLGELSERRMMLNAVITTATDFQTFYTICYLGFAIGGFYQPLLLPFLVLDIFMLNSDAAGIITAVTRPGRAITTTFVILCIESYIAALFVFLYYNNSDNLEDLAVCDTLAHCFKAVLRYGTPNVDNGYVISIGSRWLIDVFYFMQCYALLNIIKGITIDTFTELRNLKEERLADTTDVCFICGIPKVTFERSLGQVAFYNHYKIDHNLWNYFYFIVYIWEQDKDDDDGLEQYIRRAIDARDISWIPQGKCLMLDTTEEKTFVDLVSDSFRSDLRNMESKVQKSIKACEEHFKTITTKLHKMAHGQAQPLVQLANGNTSLADSMSDSVSQLSTSIKLIPKELRGVDATRFASDEIIICRFISTGSKVDITALPDGVGAFYFPEERLTVYKGDVENPGKIVCCIQIIRQSSSLESTVFVGSVEFLLDELARPSVTLIEKEFIQSVTGSVCCIAVVAVPVKMGGSSSIG